jgi:glycosyltransferase involved in cell wall biosynthesis
VVIELDGELPLGACLNQGIAAARGDIIAKVDDDHLYGPGYLSEAVAAMCQHGAPVVGKAEHFVYRVPQRELMLWCPGGSWLEQDALVGSSLVFEAHLGRTSGFRPVQLSEEALSGIRGAERPEGWLRREDAWVVEARW